jgi:two-component system nitrate/nitrite response regulator NarL
MPTPTTTATTERVVAPAPVDVTPVTVLIADDHPLFRRGIARAIHRHPALELVAEAGDGEEALELITLLEPDVAVLDHRMPGLSGVAVCAALRQRPTPSATAVLLLSAFDDDEIVSAAVRRGAAGYLGKTASQGEICDAIERVGRGGVPFATATEADDRHDGTDAVPGAGA